MVGLLGLCTPWQSMGRNSGSLQFCVSILRNDSPLTHWPCGVTSSMLIPVCAVRVTRASNETDSMSQSFFLPLHEMRQFHFRFISYVIEIELVPDHYLPPTIGSLNRFLSMCVSLHTQYL